MTMQFESIQSNDNSKLKIWRSLDSSKGIHKHNMFLVGGEKIILDFLNRPPKFEVLAILFDEDSRVQAKKFFPLKSKFFELPAKLLRTVDFMGTGGPLLLLKTPVLEKFAPREPNGLEIIAPLSDPKNLGSLIRSALAFAAKKIILTQESASPFLPEVIQASAGTCFYLPIEKGPSFAELLPLLKGKRVALDLKGQNISEYPSQRNLFLVVGQEGQGLGRQWHGEKIYIPIAKEMDSLNATVATSIALWELTKNK